jgi:AmmeMemoRadiSam system protein A
VTTPAAAAVARPDGQALARRAAAAVTARLGGRAADGRLPIAACLRAVGSTFVTLETAGLLLGCIGTLEPARPVYLDAMRNAVRAASDPRLPPVTPAQWPGVDVTVSVLSTLEPVPVNDLDDLLDALRPGVDGLILADGQRRATFLPSVWHKVVGPEHFVRSLLRKGGWSRSSAMLQGWPPDLTAVRYTTVEFRDPAPRPPVNGATASTPAGQPRLRQDDPHG